MKVTALYFALYRDELGTRAAEVELPDGATASALWQISVAGHPRLDGLRAATRFARNGRYVPPEEVLSDGDEVAFLPPVSGGSDDHAAKAPYILITPDPLDLNALVAAVQDGAYGAVVTFTGAVRHTSDGAQEVVALEYEAYEELASANLAEIVQEITHRWPIIPPGAVAIAHRTGRLVVGEASVMIAVASPHRKEAFEACVYAIDRLKDFVPIWKKEVYADGGSTWLGQRS